MALNKDTVTIGDITRELSPDALKFFTGPEFSEVNVSSTAGLVGKFVRLENLIVVAPRLEVWVDVFKKPLEHRDLMGHAHDEMGEEVARKITDADPKNNSYLHPAWQLVDAGHYSIKVDEDGQPNRLILNGESFDYGRPDDATRQATGELALAALDHEIQVVAE